MAVKSHCIDCGKELSKNKYSKCRDCNLRGKNNPNFKHGKYLSNKRCLDCGIKISYSSQSNRCQTCCRKGKLSHTFIDGRTLKKYNCQKCGKELSRYNVKSGLCQSCSHKGKYNAIF